MPVEYLYIIVVLSMILLYTHGVPMLLPYVHKDVAQDLHDLSTL